MLQEQFSKLSEKIRGSLITPASDEYEVARKVYNGMIDRRPAAIVRCADVADVMAAVNFARQDGLTVAIRGGGHNGPGWAAAMTGLVIDLSLMKGVRVDPATNRTVRAEAGLHAGRCGSCRLMRLDWRCRPGSSRRPALRASRWAAARAI